MKERQIRLKAVRNLIQSNQIDSQDELLLFLQKEGFDITQATLSRDLKALKVGKVAAGRRGYIYTLPGETEPREDRTFANDFLRGYISIKWSGNMVVIRTHSGHCDSVAWALDSFNLQEVLGTISGRDNTVFVVLKEGTSGETFMNSLKKHIPEIGENNEV